MTPSLNQFIAVPQKGFPRLLKAAVVTKLMPVKKNPAIPICVKILTSEVPSLSSMKSSEILMLEMASIAQIIRV